MFLRPMQFATHGQWWSMRITQRPQRLQWWARGGLSHLQYTQWERNFSRTASYSSGSSWTLTRVLVGLGLLELEPTALFTPPTPAEDEVSSYGALVECRLLVPEVSFLVWNGEEVCWDSTSPTSLRSLWLASSGWVPGRLLDRRPAPGGWLKFVTLLDTPDTNLCCS